MIRSILTILGLTAFITNQAYAEDGLNCSRERPTFRQFCSVKTDEYTQINTLNFANSYGTVELPTQETLKTAVFKLKNSDTTEDKVLLSGLIPELRIVTDLSNMANCKIAGLWRNRLVVQTRSEGLDLLQSSISYGPQDHQLTLAYYNEDSIAKSFFTYREISATSVQLSTRFNLKNLDTTIASEERIPLECRLDLSGQVVGFNATRIRTDLKWLKTLAQSKDRELIKSFILNGFYLDQQRGAVCSVKSLADTLKNIEILPESEPYSSLSVMSQSAISASIQNAIDLGAISKNKINADDPDGKWNFFISSDGQNFFSTTCATAPLKYKVDKSKFIKDGVITHNTAYQNAVDFEREQGNLLQILGATWALIGAAVADINASNDLKWVIDPSLYSHFE